MSRLRRRHCERCGEPNWANHKCPPLIDRDDYVRLGDRVSVRCADCGKFTLTHASKSGRVVARCESCEETIVGLLEGYSLEPLAVHHIPSPFDSPTGD